MTERNYVLHFIGQAISFSGMWLQNVALGYLVYEITSSKIWLGIVSAIPLLVSTFLLPYGGVLADRYDKRKILYITQTMGFIQAISLGILVLSHNASIWNICILSVCLGLITSIDNPARNSFIPEIVQREHIGSGVALNGVMIMLARVFGPGLAGFLILLIGTGWTFVVNGLSFLPVFVTLSMMRIKRKEKRLDKSDFWSGLKFTFSHPQVKMCFILSGTIGAFGMSYNGILPAVVKDVFHSGPKLLGYMGSAVGLGAFIGGSIVSAKSKKLPFNIFIIVGCLASGLALILFPLASNIYIALAMLSLAGAGFTLSFSTVRAESQIVTREICADMQGRVTSLIVMAFFAGMAVGNLLVGYLSKKYGFFVALGSNGLALLLISLVVFIKPSQFKLNK